MQIVNRISYAHPSGEIFDMSKIKNDTVDRIVSDITEKLSQINYESQDVTFYFDGDADNLFEGQHIEVSFTSTPDDEVNLRIKQAISNIYTQ